VKRTILTITIALAAVLLPTAQRAWAQPNDKPTAEQLEAAKKAFAEGKAFHDQGKLPEAIEKFKESYRLSRNPVLLYNIALTLDENKQTDNALFYYRKFLSDAPQDASQRPTVTEKVKTLEKKGLK
jgi:tetratricopeptide (TPR) repeat protein